MGAEDYYFERTGSMLVRPITCRIRCTFSGGTGVVAKSTTRRQSDHDTVITGSAGTYTLTNLPKGRDYHLNGLIISDSAGGGTVTANTLLIPVVSAFDASAGTMTIVTRINAGTAAAPSNTAIMFVTFDVETGVY